MIEIRALELLCSRLCHDLVSPVAAINNGIEILEEYADSADGPGDGFRAEAMQLIAQAAGQADGRLRMFRLAYGRAGGEASGLNDARAAAQAWFAAGRTKLRWPAGDPPDSVARRGGVIKATLNLLVLADEALTHGGVVAVAGAGNAAAGELTVTAEGRPGALSDELRTALSGTAAVADLTPRAVHAFVTGIFLRAADIGLKIEARPGEGVDFRLNW